MGKTGITALLLLPHAVLAASPDLQSLLVAPSQAPYKWFASTDPQHKNQDYLLLKPGETRRIPLADGNLERLWSTATEPTKIILALQNSSEATWPAYRVTPLLSNGQARHGSVYEKAFTFYPTANDPDLVRVLRNWTPDLPHDWHHIPQGSPLLIVKNEATQPNKFFYQVAIRPGHVTPPSLAGSPTIQSETGKIAPGKDLRHTLNGPGVMDEIEITPTTPTPQTWQDLRLQVWWDDVNGADAKEAPAINAPLSALAGHFLGGGAVDNKLWTFDGKSLRLHVSMPYGAAALMVLKNGGAAEIQARLHIEARQLPPNAKVSPYRFCAVYGAAQTQQGQPVQMLHADGAGAFIGLSLGIEPTKASSRRAFAYLEGNETITADGQKYEGTGTEDFFNSAWYFPDKPFSHPYDGLSVKNKMPPQVAMYRLKFSDAVPFRKSLNFAFEHASGNSSNDLLYRWVAFWYQQPLLKFQVEDKLANGAAAGASGDNASNAAELPTGNTSTLLALLVGGIGVALGVGVARYTRRKR